MESLKELKQKINVAFRALRKAGYTAKQNFWCCQSCGRARMEDLNATKYVFYHQQDAEHLRSRGEVYLAWTGDGREIVSIMEKAGLKVEWDGSEGTRIMVGANELGL